MQAVDEANHPKSLNVQAISDIKDCLLSPPVDFSVEMAFLYRSCLQRSPSGSLRSCENPLEWPFPGLSFPLGEELE